MYHIEYCYRHRVCIYYRGRASDRVRPTLFSLVDEPYHYIVT